VGCVIAKDNHDVISHGYNGFPRKVKDTPERLNNRATKLALTLHAELNALLTAAKSVEGCTAYVWPMPPCSQCAAALIQAGVTRIVAPMPRDEHQARWGDGFHLAEQMYQDAGVQLTLACGARHGEHDEIGDWWRRWNYDSRENWSPTALKFLDAEGAFDEVV
jgi:dCMP deaminase